ncbi:Protein kinase C-like 1 [Balamuthia mandrillaris]
MINRERAIDYLNTRERLYVIDGYAGWVEKYRLKVRVICARAYHALFMKNMLIRPTPEQLAEFGEPDFVIYNAGQFPANRYTKGMTSSTSVAINFKRMEAVILGTEYAGEMKKGIFTVMHYIMPLRGVLSLHSSCNEGLPSSNNNEEEDGRNGDVSLFFGLSGTGKTTLSADPRRKLIGDDEHVWYEDGIFNIEGGCYAKAIGLDPAQEPEIFQAVRFGAVLENVVFDERTREVDYNDASITENTRTAYPIEFIPNAKIPCLSVGHPRNIIMLCCDAFGVLPPVSRLTPEQASYYFISGYTAKVAGTEQGITEPQVAFSPGFGAAFLVWHPAKYAEMLAERVKRHGTYCWLVSTGWTAGGYGVGYRIKLRHTRAIIDGIHSGELASAEYETLPYFNLQIPKSCSNVPPELLHPRKMWQDKEAYDHTLNNLAKKFVSNFSKYADLTAPEISAVGPTPE